MDARARIVEGGSVRFGHWITVVAPCARYSEGMKTGVVLGGGGLVGISYHSGVLKALHELGLHPGVADVVVGTSAGALVAAYLGSGWATDAFYEYSHGRRETVVPAAKGKDARPLFTPMWKTRPEQLRRAVGGVVALASSAGRWPDALEDRFPRARLEELFPYGMYSIDDTRKRLEEDLPAAWPREDLYICAADLHTGRRRAFTKSNADGARFTDAVLASVAIPGFFPPVAIGGHSYVDAGIVSATSLDLAVAAGCEAILCIAPLGYRTDGSVKAREPKVWPPMLTRAVFERLLDRALAEAKAHGVEVLVVKPSLTELKPLGASSMRAHDYGGVADAAFESTLRFMAKHDGHLAVAGLRRPDSLTS